MHSTDHGQGRCQVCRVETDDAGDGECQVRVCLELSFVSRSQGQDGVTGSEASGPTDGEIPTFSRDL